MKTLDCSKNLILSIDQGTSGSKAIVFNPLGEILAQATVKQASIYPKEGFVEQSPEELYSSVIAAVFKVLSVLKKKGISRENISCCGISNQRETFILWDKFGSPLHNAVVWQCKRSVDICRRFKDNGVASDISAKTGLLMDPYFSGTKVLWLLENDRDIRESILKGDAYFGTVDTWLLYNLTMGQSYKTDFTNASRTMFFNLNKMEWDKDILDSMDLKNLNLPEICPSDSLFGYSDFQGIFEKAIPITGVAGDSHAASFGERCFSPGSVKITLGTGSSILMNTGEHILQNNNGLVSTICWSTKERTSYAKEGIIVSCGATMNWLKDTLGLFTSDQEADKMAESQESSHGVYVIPAFSGLGAPFWMMDQKARIEGLTFGTTRQDIVRAALDTIPFQIKAVMDRMVTDSGLRLQNVKLDGGLTSSSPVMMSVASLLKNNVERVMMKEASALGAALLAALGLGFFSSIEEIEKLKYDKSVVKAINNDHLMDDYIRWYTLIMDNKGYAG